MSEHGIEYLTGSRKRQLDVIGGLTLLAATLPLDGLLSFGATLDTLDNPIFSQSRIGQDGEEFQVLKFRSLKVKNVEIGSDERGTNHSCASKFGNFMRRFCLDELPQIINLVKGDMSLVGLRPLMGADIDRIRDIEPKIFDDWFYIYKATRPGLTGPGQIHRKLSVEPEGEVWKEAMRLDLNYAENATLRGDLRIVSSTPIVLIKKELLQ